MFQVTATTLAEYLDFDRARRSDLVGLHALLRKAAPDLRRHCHKGTPAGEPGMRMKMIGYGKFRYTVKSRKTVEWPVIGVALQMSYSSVYVAVTKAGAPIVPNYAGQLGELRMGRNNFSFERFADLKTTSLSSLFAELPTYSNLIRKILFDACRVDLNRAASETLGSRAVTGQRVSPIWDFARWQACAS